MTSPGKDQEFGTAGVPPFGEADSRLASGGLSWSWELDLSAVVEAMTGRAPWLRTDDDDDDRAAADSAAADRAVASATTRQPATDPAVSASGPLPAADALPAAADPAPATDADDADEAAWQEAIAAWRADEIPLDVVAGRVAESLPVGPGLAGWLAQSRAADLEDGALAGVAASFRRLASWAAAGELAAVAQIASRSARTDRRAEVDQDGRPDRVTADASGQVALALAMSHDGATSWADLGVVLTWRLPATGAALAAGQIDLARARMIVRMTSSLSEAAARGVEAAVLGRAGWQTLGQLHAALRRAVIKADPEGAERRRQDAERNAKVVLYPEDEGTATLAGYSLPGVQAAAAMARIAALAKAMNAAGTSSGQIDLVRAQVFLGLLLGTLPYIPPADGAPPDDPLPSDDPPANDDPPPPDDPLPSDDPPPPDDPPASDDPPVGQAGPWPDVPPFLPAGPPNLAGPQPLPGAAGLLNLTVPFAALAGISAAPAHLSRLGVITADQARLLADVAARHLATRWRIIVTTASGEAIAVSHVPRSRSPGGSPAATAGGTGLVGRVTLIVSADALAERRGAGDASRPWAGAARWITTGRDPGPGAGSGHPGRRGQAAERAGSTSGPAAAATRWSRTPTGRRRGSAERVRRETGPAGSLRAAGQPKALRPRPHSAVRPGRTHLRVQPRRTVPLAPSAQAGSALDAAAACAGDIPVDDASRADLHLEPRSADT